MRKIIANSLIFVFLFMYAAFAQISIQAVVDKTRLSTDESITYKLVVTSSEKKLPLPQLPKFQGFNILSQTQSSTVSFGKGEIKTVLVHTYILAPLEVGKFKIEPTTVKIKNQTYSSQEFEIEVTPGKRKIQAPGKDEPTSPAEPRPGSEEPQYTL